MRIVVEVVSKPVNESVHPGPPGGTVGYQNIFSDNLVLREVEGCTPGDGLPGSVQDPPRAGTQSGVVTTLATAKNNLFISVPDGGYLLQHESTYRLKAVPGTPRPGSTPPGLREGQITTQGVFPYPTPPGESKTLAITGGTNVYANARGKITEEDNRRILEIVL
jgi:hypothetical protein